MQEDSKEHWNEILQAAKDANGGGLDPVRRADLRKSVFEHIDREFPPEQFNQSSVKDNSGFKPLEWLWKNIIPGPAIAIAVAALVTAGILLDSDSYFDLPESIVAANLQSQIEVQGGGSRGLVSSKTALQGSFISGVLQAQNDLSGKDVADGDTGDLWYREGFQIEVIHLAAKQAINTRNSEVLEDVLRHYRLKNKHNVEVLENADVSAEYLNKRRELNDVDDVSSPDSWDRIYSLTRSLKILAR